MENIAELHYLKAVVEGGHRVSEIKFVKTDPLVIESRQSGALVHSDEYKFWIEDTKDNMVKELETNYDRIRFRIYSKDSFSNFGKVHQQYYSKDSIK